MYVEGRVRAMHSVLVDNVADRCGGLIYSAGAHSNFDSCKIAQNSCGHHDCKQIHTEPGTTVPSWRKAAPSPGADDDDDDDDIDGDSAARDGDDASGAIAEGPSLLT